MTKTLILEFNGWAIIRLPTDPDPTDEPRGVSGYTFAFAGEPDLDRVIHLQTPTDFAPRSHGFQIGVQVRRALRRDANGDTPIQALHNARVELLDRPKLENRNWTLTPAGYEPVSPFHLLITGDGITLRRRAPIDPHFPDEPLWKLAEEKLRAQGANGMEYEPATIGQATDIWDALQVSRDRLQKLEQDLQALQKKKRPTPQDQIAIAALEGRIAELQIGVRDPTDRRISTRYYVERFGFPMMGEAEVKGDQRKLLGGKLATDAKTPWSIYFWFGAWDPDLLTAFMQGVLEVPYADGK